jgi:hypothetical protein
MCSLSPIDDLSDLGMTRLRQTHIDRHTHIARVSQKDRRPGGREAASCYRFQSPFVGAGS